MAAVYDAIECGGVNGKIIFALTALSGLYVALQHILVQRSFASFSVLFFFLQVGSLVLEPETVTALFSQFGTSVIDIDCPYPRRGYDAITYDLMRAVSPFPLLALVWIF